MKKQHFITLLLPLALFSLARAQAPTILTHPSPNVVSDGESSSFTVMVRGAASTNIHFSWRRNGVSVAERDILSAADGVCISDYSTAKTTFADDGALYSVVVGTPPNTVTSSNAQLKVNRNLISLFARGSNTRTANMYWEGDATRGSFIINGPGSGFFNTPFETLNNWDRFTGFNGEGAAILGIKPKQGSGAAVALTSAFNFQANGSSQPFSARWDVKIPAPFFLAGQAYGNGKNGNTWRESHKSFVSFFDESTGKGYKVMYRPQNQSGVFDVEVLRMDGAADVSLQKFASNVYPSKGDIVRFVFIVDGAGKIYLMQDFSEHPGQNTFYTLLDNNYKKFTRAKFENFRTDAGTSEYIEVSSISASGLGEEGGPDFSLSNGTLSLKRLNVNQIVTTPKWKIPDYVFEKGYKLQSLPEIEAFVRKNGHLPEIPSAKEVGEKGLDLVEMNVKLLKKVEELTLHQIELQKRLNTQEKKIRTLQAAGRATATAGGR